MSKAKELLQQLNEVFSVKQESTVNASAIKRKITILKKHLDILDNVYGGTSNPSVRGNMSHEDYMANTLKRIKEIEAEIDNLRKLLSQQG